MKKELSQVKQFRDAFKMRGWDTPAAPRQVDAAFRLERLKEETQELLEGFLERDIIKIADAYGDLLYIVYGGILEAGLGGVMEQVFDEIHRSNMTKRDTDGEYRVGPDNKIPKTPYYSPPELEFIIELGKLSVVMGQPSSEEIFKRQFIEAQFAEHGINLAELGEEADEVERIWEAYKKKPDFIAVLKAMEIYKNLTQ